MADEAMPEAVTEPVKDMDVETLDAADQTDCDPTINGGKRLREEGDEPEEEKNAGEGKKLKGELDKLETVDGEKETGTVPTGPVTLGLKSFETSVEMFDYFYKFLHSWPPNVKVNKYEHLMLLDLLKKGSSEPEKKIKAGVHFFQVRFHPKYRSRCFFLVRENGSFDDFSFRKCVNHILPLPENMQLNPGENKAFGGGRGNWRGGRGRGGKPRN